MTETNKNGRMIDWAKRSKYGLFAMSDGEQHMEIAMSVSGKPVKSLESMKEDDFLRILSIANSMQSKLLDEFFRRHPEKNAELQTFIAKGGMA